MSDGKMQEMVRGMKSIDNMQLGCASSLEEIDVFMTKYFPEARKSGNRWIICSKCSRIDKDGKVTGYRASDRFALIMHINKGEHYTIQDKEKKNKSKEVDEGAQELSF